MVEMGVLDPTKVTRTALQNAASVAGLMLTTDCMVAELPEDKPAVLACRAWAVWVVWAVWTWECNSRSSPVYRGRMLHQPRESGVSCFCGRANRARDALPWSRWARALASRSVRPDT